MVMKLPHDNVLLICERGHEHIVGDLQVEAILPTPCPWCRTSLRIVMHGTEPVKHAAWDRRRAA
jgi:hypothetical protein